MKRLCACWEYDIGNNFGVLDIVGVLHTSMRCARIEEEEAS